MSTKGNFAADQANPPPEMLRGHLDLILLSILERQPLYGFAIIQEAKARTNGYFEFKEGSLYPALHRLQAAGWLQAIAGEVGRNGKPRKYYALTDVGRLRLSEKRAEFERFSGAVRSLAGG